MTSLTCNKCKHLIGVRDRTENWEQWKCGHPKNIEKEETHLIIGVPIKMFIVPLCGDQRYNPHRDHLEENICGLEGKWFEEYEEHKFEPTIGGKEPVELEVFDEATLKANREKAAERVAAIKAKGKLSKDDLSNL